MISAIICTYNRERFLPKLFESIRHQTLPRNSFEVVFVNNNCTDNTKNISLKFKEENPDIHFHYFEEYNQGLSFARNRGIKEAKGSYLTFLDDDAFLDTNFLKTTVDFFKSNNRVLAIGGKIVLDYETSEPTWYTHYLGPLLGYFNLGDITKSFPKNNYPRGSNMSFRKEVFTVYGIFDTALGRIGKILVGGEEKEFFSRMKKKYNHIWYLPSAIVYHCVPQERTTHEFIKQQALGTGKSEAIRIRNKNFKTTAERYAQELIKWMASLILLMYYLITFEPAKGIMIVRFRAWVTKGLLSAGTGV